ncbi:uncharacterized protein BJ212DRAFT_1580734 [Suillus subaureus]|uniref:Uncharacterized protein n=1 Tax=Suillus subaureus TaxID=48587 RepID=A0A9P7J6T0_9AGAM|nr:uncharacterized protein BJ212DRAFT_1580734 [Suillus subaureus]KAG1805522.1 hypothetical protein BJ212DRAFT_1580734 [Suillus subaureus]
MTFAKGIPLDSAAIMSIVLESILYGFSVLMFIGTIWALTYKRHMRDVNRPITAVAILLFALSTAHMVIGIIRTEEGLEQYRDNFPSGTEAFSAEISRETFVINNTIVVLQALLGDGVVKRFWIKIYRCYVVWQTVWVIILSSILWCSAAVTGGYSIYSVSHTTSISGHVFSKATRLWIAAFSVLTIVTNLLSSGLLAYRIWKIERSVTNSRTTKITTTSILRVLMDAAILYSMALLCTLVAMVCSNDGSLVMIDVLTPIISITFYMVIIRIAMGRKNHGHILTVRGGSTSETDRGNLQHYTLQPLQVHISRFTHTDGASVYRNGRQDRPSTGKEVFVEGASCTV